MLKAGAALDDLPRISPRSSKGPESELGDNYRPGGGATKALIKGLTYTPLSFRNSCLCLACVSFVWASTCISTENTVFPNLFHAGDPSTKTGTGTAECGQCEELGEVVLRGFMLGSTLDTG